MELRELIKKIRQEKNWTQAQMGAELQIAQQDVQGMENAGRNLEKQFGIFLKLAVVCEDLGIDPARSLKHPVAKEVIEDAQQHGRKTGRNDTNGEGKAKERDSRAIPARRNKAG